MSASMTIILAVMAAAGEPSTPADEATRTAPPSLTAAPQPMGMTAAAFDIAAAVSTARAWGIVTSTYRSPAHNARVGGAPGSYHLRNRAIDIARHPGVTHARIDAAFRVAGFRLIESLDEGDHSHFAFADPEPVETGPIATIVGDARDPSRWRMVFTPRARD